MLRLGSEELDPSPTDRLLCDPVQEMAARVMDCTGSGRAADGALPGVMCVSVQCVRRCKSRSAKTFFKKASFSRKCFIHFSVSPVTPQYIQFGSRTSAMPTSSDFIFLN